MKKYIMLAADIHTMGGAQNYVRSKMIYLRKKGWKPYVLFDGTPGGSCAFSDLNEYVNGGLLSLGKKPDELMGTLAFEIAMNQMLEIVEHDVKQKCEYLIESSNEIRALWGELIAKRTGGRNICFITQETFREPWQHFTEYMDFFLWKYSRGELFGIENESVSMMLDGYCEVPDSSNYRLIAAHYDNVFDIEISGVTDIEKLDCNIAYFGRTEKQYFKKAVSSIEGFVKRHTNLSIHFIVIGEPKGDEMALLNNLESFFNVKITITGMLPILPKRLFQKIDAIIAGAGCAHIAFCQRIPVIVPDARTGQAMGILGIHTTSLLFGKEYHSYIELLEYVLLEGGDKYIDWHSIPAYNKDIVDKCFDDFFEKISISQVDEKYYNFESKRSMGLMINSKNILKTRDIYNKLGDAESEEWYRRRLDLYLKNIEWDDFAKGMDLGEISFPDFDSFYDGFSEKPPIIICGAGKAGRFTLEWLLRTSKYKDRILCICDKNAAYISDIHGIPVKEYEDATAQADSVVYFIAVLAEHTRLEIYNKLRNCNVNSGNIFVQYGFAKGYCKGQYFDLFEPQVDEFFLDCGCINVETSKQFSDWCQGDYKRIIAFEGDTRNVEICRVNADVYGLKNITILNKCCWDKKERVPFIDQGDGASMIMEGQKKLVDACRIDDIEANEKITFIKMDIEGAEEKALIGAGDTIRRWHPTLAISIYHKADDILRIPVLIDELYDGYTYYIRHYTNYTSETIFYALPKGRRLLS